MATPNCKPVLFRVLTYWIPFQEQRQEEQEVERQRAVEQQMRNEERCAREERQRPVAPAPSRASQDGARFRREAMQEAQTMCFARRTSAR